MFAYLLSFLLCLAIVEFGVNQVQSQCVESGTWDENDNNICTYTECTCASDNATAVCRNYTADDQSNMGLFEELCDQVRYAGCTNVNNLFWESGGGGGSLNRCRSSTTTCPLYCGCNETQTDSEYDVYYTNVDVYEKTCYQCGCTTYGFLNDGEYLRECSVSDSVQIDDSDWSTWTCPSENNNLVCARRDDGATTTCSNSNDTMCYIQSTFELDIGDLNWDFGDTSEVNYTLPDIFWRNTTTTYGCESSLDENYFCQVFDALDYSVSCANVSFSAWNVEECDNYTIVGYNISYFQELMCCQGDSCNYGFTQNINAATNENQSTTLPPEYADYNCTTADDTMSNFYSTINACQASLAAVESTYGHYQYCYTGSSFFDTYQYCEYLASRATFNYGCVCEAYAILYNSPDADSDIKDEIEAKMDAYQETIESIWQSAGYCCEIEFDCDLSKSKQKATITLDLYDVSFNVRVNNTNNDTFDKGDFIADTAEEVGIYESEISISNLNFYEKESDNETMEYAIFRLTLTIGCEAAAEQFIDDLTNENSQYYSFGYDTTINEDSLDYSQSEYEYSTSSGQSSSSSTSGSGSSNSSTSEELDGGAIAGIVIGCIVFVALLIVAVWWFFLRNKDSSSSGSSNNKKKLSLKNVFKKEGNSDDTGVSPNTEIRASVHAAMSNGNHTTPGQGVGGKKLTSPPPDRRQSSSDKQSARMKGGGGGAPPPPPPPPGAASSGY